MNQSIENLVEVIVEVFIDILLNGNDYRMFCNCEVCKNKIITHSLNHLPTYYVCDEEQRNRAYVEIKDKSYIDNINKQIIIAVHTVGSYVNHISVKLPE